MGEHTAFFEGINTAAKAQMDQVLDAREPDALPTTRPLDFEWAIIAFAVGIGVYFWLPLEPDWRIFASLAALGAAVLWMFRYSPRIVVKTTLLLCLMMVTGVGRAGFHSAQVAAPRLSDYRATYTVTGWVEAVERSGTSYRWRIRVHDMYRYDEQLSETLRPLKVRIRTKTHDFLPGDAVSLRALLTGPPGPVIADGYDPAQRAFFEQIGGYGFAIASPEPAEFSVAGLERFSRARVRFRGAISARILENAPEATAGLQTALLTGERAYIPEAQIEALRAAGLAHVLAISGLHMGLVAGSAYFILTLLLASIDKLARRYDVRKFAAIMAMVVATFYLLLSTGTVSIQRAYIMAVVMFAAIVLGRPAISMRSVALAAAITLFIHPEALVTAGFQMSFAAVAALVTVYGLWRERFGVRYNLGPVAKIRNALIGVGVTSTVAGAATDGFAAMHFHYITRYGLLGNLLALPLFTFIIMPMGAIAVLLMPLGLEIVPLAIMGWGLEHMIAIAQWVASLSGAKRFFPAAPAWAIGIYGFGFTLLCIGPFKKRLAGLGFIAITFIAWTLTPQADLRISDSGNIAFWDVSQTGRVLYTERRRADSYGRGQFIERAGLADADVTEYSDGFAACDRQACRMLVKGRRVSVVATPEAVLEECAQSDLVILTERAAGPILKRRCAVPLIDSRRLIDEGAQNVYLPKQGAIRFKPANPPRR